MSRTVKGAEFENRSDRFPGPGVRRTVGTFEKVQSLESAEMVLFEIRQEGRGTRLKFTLPDIRTTEQSGRLLEYLSSFFSISRGGSSALDNSMCDRFFALMWLSDRSGERIPKTCRSRFGSRTQRPRRWLFADTQLANPREFSLK
ncbi:hypothetical protein TNCT_483271 [Trichonephila clavata]|uniref:Uncharacterized protein n=1 Tax=Trichonephila clavata TaxID=2740835 RepID=A0A8X6F1I6_TRICU|nr:hypothetical protein TNCT_483271 [Trichonephila clavata]